MPDVEIVQELDGEGCPITLGRLLGSWTAPWPHLMQQTIRAQQFTFHHSDILLIGYSKSGNTNVFSCLSNNEIFVVFYMECYAIKRQICSMFSSYKSRIETFVSFSL